MKLKIRAMIADNAAKIKVWQTKKDTAGLLGFTAQCCLYSALIEAMLEVNKDLEELLV